MSGVDYIKENTDIVSETLDLQLTQFQNSENIKSLLEIIASESADQEVALISLSEGFLLENAEGVQLDIIGQFLRVFREDSDDETFRGKIAVAIAGAATPTSRDDIVELVTILSGGSLPDIYIGLTGELDISLQQSCYDPSVIGAAIGQYLPLGTQGSILMHNLVPFGFEGNPKAGAFASTVDADNVPELNFGNMSTLIFVSDNEEDSYDYPLNSGVVNAISLGSGFDKPLVNSLEFRSFTLEVLDPANPVSYLSAHGASGVRDVRTILEETGTLQDYRPLSGTLYYEVTPTIVPTNDIGSITHHADFGSYTGAETFGLSITVTVECLSSTPKLILNVTKTNTVSSASATVEFTGLSEVYQKRVGIYINPVTRTIGYAINGVDQGEFLADVSDDGENPIGQPFKWTDRRAYSGNFYMTGLRNTTPAVLPSDTVGMRWDYQKGTIGDTDMTGLFDIFGRLL